MDRRFLKQVARAVVFAAIALGSSGVALAWTGPTTAPPGGNVSAPINTSATGQNKAGPFGVNGGYSLGYPFSVSNAGFSSWTAIFNWPYNTATGYGILVGSSASGYSQFQNGSGYYSLIAYGSYGLYTNGSVYAAGGIGGPGGFGGGFQLTNGGGCYVANTATGGCSCPGYAPNARWAYYMDTNSTYGGGRGYLCEGM